MTGIPSQLYKILISLVATKPTSYQLLWQKSSLLLTDDDWAHLWSSFPFRSSIFVIQWQTIKIMMHWYYTPAKLHKLSPSFNPKCVKGCEEIADYLHMWWHCPVIKAYWIAILAEIKQIVDVDILFTYPCILLNFWDQPDTDPTNKEIVITFLDT